MTVTATLCSVGLTRRARHVATAASRPPQRACCLHASQRATVLGAGAAPRPPAYRGWGYGAAGTLPQSVASRGRHAPTGCCSLGTASARQAWLGIAVTVCVSFQYQALAGFRPRDRRCSTHAVHSAIGAVLRSGCTLTLTRRSIASAPVAGSPLRLARCACGRASPRAVRFSVTPRLCTARGRSLGASVASVARARAVLRSRAAVTDSVSVEEAQAGERVKGGPRQTSGHTHGGAEPPSCAAHPFASGPALTISPVQGGAVAIAPARQDGDARASQSNPKHVTTMTTRKNPYDRTPRLLRVTIGDLDTIAEALAYAMTEPSAKKAMSKAYHLRQTHDKVARRISRLTAVETDRFSQL